MAENLTRSKAAQAEFDVWAQALRDLDAGPRPDGLPRAAGRFVSFGVMSTRRGRSQFAAWAIGSRGVAACVGHTDVSRLTPGLMAAAPDQASRPAALATRLDNRAPQEGLTAATAACKGLLIRI